MIWSKLKLGTKFMLVVGIVIVVFLGTNLYISISRQRNQLMNQLEGKAKFIATQLMIDRQWAAKAYNNKKLLIEPTQMNVETAKIADSSGLYNIRLISSTPINPDNSPKDDFEKTGLRALEEGKPTHSSVAKTGSGNVYRWMTPDKITSEACIECHENKKVGDVLGAMSVTVPMGEVETAIRSNSLILTGIAAIMILLIGAVIYLLIRRMIINPLKSTAHLASAVANGDLTEEIEVRTSDEMGELGNSLMTMNYNLQEMISKISQCAELVASSAEELSASSEQLARSSQESSSQTDQVATATEEMSATILEVAKNSSQAADSSKKALETANKGGEIVSQSIRGMNQIAQTVQKSTQTIKTLGENSQQIGEITAVIDDIADQTNLLALNAAIEAARAGEQGRGFAVVADEVRKLAERTTKATKEISSMIKSIQSDTIGAVSSMEAGTTEVAKGVDMTLKAGESLKEIVNMVQNVSDMINQIATATEEQSTAAEEISTSIDTIASLTKESTAGIEQSSTASRELSRLALELREMVGQFKFADKQEEKIEKKTSLIKIKGKPTSLKKTKGAVKEVA